MFVRSPTKHRPTDLLSRSIRNHPRELYQEIKPTARRARYPHQGAHICTLTNCVPDLSRIPGLLPYCQGRRPPRWEPGRFRHHQSARIESQGTSSLWHPNERQPTTIAISQHIFDSVKASLKRLQLDYIDVLQCASRSVSVPRLRQTFALQVTALTTPRQSRKL